MIYKDDKEIKSDENLKLNFRDILFKEQINNLKEESEMKAQANYDTVTYFVINVIMSCNTLNQLECAKKWGLRLVQDKAEMSVIVGMVIDQQYMKIAEKWNNI